jgi:hypothetical protein
MLYYFSCNANGSSLHYQVMFRLMLNILLDARHVSGGVVTKTGCPRELYPNMLSKNVLVPPDLPVPNYDCAAVC